MKRKISEFTLGQVNFSVWLGLKMVGAGSACPKKKSNAETQRRIFDRAKSTESAMGAVCVAFSPIYSSASLRLRVRFLYKIRILNTKVAVYCVPFWV